MQVEGSYGCSNFLKKTGIYKIIVYDFYTLTREMWRAKALGISPFNNV